MSPLTIKIATLYAACSPELGVVSYGRCQDEALNNLTDELAVREMARKGRGASNAELAREGKSHG